MNRYLGVEANAGGGLHIAWLLDFAELPAAQEIARLDRDRDGAVTPAERDAYLDVLVPSVIAQWRVERNGVLVTPRVLHRAIEVQPGQSGLETLRVLGELEVEPLASPTQHVTVHIVDRSYGDRTGMRDLRADDSEAARVISAPADAPVRSPDGTTLRRTDEATFVFALRSRVESATAITTVTDARTAQTRSVVIAIAGLAWAIALALGLARRDCDPRVRIVVTVAFALATTLARAEPTALATLATFALIAAVAVRPRASWLASRLAIALAWAAALGASRAFTTHEGFTSGPIAMMVRIAISLVAVLPLVATTSLTRFADALASLPLPSLFIDTTVSTARGVAILRDEAARIARARMLRAPRAGFATRVALFGSYASAVVTRGLDRAARTHLAFVLRGGTARVAAARARTPWRSIAALAFGVVALILAARVP